MSDSRGSLSVNVPVPLVCLSVPLQRSRSETGPSLAQGSTGPPEEDVLGGIGEPQGSALGVVTATGGGGNAGEGRVTTRPYRYNAQQGGSRKLGWVPTGFSISLTPPIELMCKGGPENTPVPVYLITLTYPTSEVEKR